HRAAAGGGRGRRRSRGAHPASPRARRGRAGAARDASRVRGRVVVNDLARTPLALGLVWLATRLLPVHPMSRHDGPLSVRRALAPSELGALFGAAGVTRATVTRYPWLARLVVEAT